MAADSAILAAALTAAVVTLSSCAASAPVVVRVDVAVRLTPDGQADVHESIAVRVDAPTTFERVVRPDRAESLAFGGAWIDGAPVPGVDGNARTALRVTWPLDEPHNRVRTLELRYRAFGVLAIHGRRGELVWSALPVPRDYSIGGARIVLTVPAGTLRVGEWGLAEPDWTVVELPDGIAATRTGLSSRDQATLLAGVALDPARMVEPRWQHDAEFGRQLIPAFIAGGLFILVIGVGVIGIIWFERVSRTRDRRWRPSLPPQTAQGLYAAGVACLIFGSIMAGIVYVWIGRYGAWALAIPISVLLVGLLFVLVGKRSEAAADLQGGSDGGADLQVGPP